MSDGDREPKPIGIDLGELGKGRPVMRPSHGQCPGALLMISRYDYDRMVDGGEVFATPRREMPAEGRHDARVHCNGQVMRQASSLGGGEVVYGLCASCSGLEANLRQTRREQGGQR